MDNESPIYLQQLPPNIYSYANEYFKEKLETLYCPDLYILPLTTEGEQQREYLINYHHNGKGELIWQSIYRYGAYEYNFIFENDIYLAILVNND